MRPLTSPSRLARTGCSVLALATALVVGPSPAAAQSFLGTGNFATNGGGAASIGTGPNTTTVTLNPGQTVINWTPTDNAVGGGAIGFQPSGTTATFTGASNFAVLNNINQADFNRAVSMNGTINSLVGGVQGGSVYFYSPGGFLLGQNSIINVGSLVLSASPIAVSGGNFINGSNTVVFGQAPNPSASIVTSSGAGSSTQINAFAGDAYVAMVAPRVEHHGVINVTGSAALVGAEAAIINFSPSGLFDIQVTAGSTDANGVYYAGRITGAPSTGAGDIHRAYLVAVPKNAAMTMLITSGSVLGFDVAGAADVVGNTVVLSAGHDVGNGLIADVSAGSTGAAIANLDVRDSLFTSATVGEATGTAFLSASTVLRFHSDVSIHAGGEIGLSTQSPGGSVEVDGSLSLSTEQFGGNGEDVASSRVEIFNANGGSITVDGATTIDTDAWGGGSGVAGVNGGDATAGNIDVMASNGGSIALLGGLTASADGHAGGASGAGVDGGVGTGGHVVLRTAGNASALTIDDGVSINASGYGGSGAGVACSGCDGDGGNGRGGDIDIYSGDGLGSTLNITGNVSAVADGWGGAAAAAGAGAGTGYGGSAAYYVGTGTSMTLTGSLLLQGEGNGGNHAGAAGGAGYGGEAAISETITATSGTMVINGDVELSSDGQGGTTSAAGAAGGIGVGGGGAGGSANGSSYILADTASMTINGSANLHSTGTGGASPNGIGGIGNGGLSSVRSNSLLTVAGSLNVTALGTGGNGAAGGGNATGGEAYVRAFSGGTIAIGTGGGGGVLLSADGSGGDSANGTGGNGTGGELAEIWAQDGDVTIAGLASVSASGFGGDGLHGGDGLGSGTAPTLTAPGVGGAHILAQNGDIAISGGASVSAIGTGGNGGLGSSGGSGGNGTGGWATIHAGNSNAGPSRITVTSGSTEGSGFATVTVSGAGGDGGDGLNGNAGGAGGSGGNGAGGTGSITAAAGNGTVTISNAAVYSTGAGGAGGDGGAGSGLAGGDGGTGGSGIGGGATIGTASGSAQSLGVNNGFGDYGSIIVDASASGGAGGAGRSGATGGDGGNGGSAVGGTANLLVRGSRVDVHSATLAANATGGAAGFGAGPTGTTGIGGDATVGGDGGIRVEATGRFQIPAHRGTLNAGAISGTAIATPGIGIPNGMSQNLGGSVFIFLNADGNIGSLDMLVQTGMNSSNAGVDSISVINGNVTVDGEFSFVTSGNLSLFADNGDMASAILTLSADDFLFDAVNDPPANRGTYFADSATIATSGNFVTSANLDIGSDLQIVAPGLINAHDLDIDGDLDLVAQGGGITANDLDVSGAIDLDASAAIDLNVVEAGFFRADAGSFFTSGDIASDSNIQIFAGDDVSLGQLVAGPTADINSNKAIRIITDGSVGVGNILSAGGIDITALGSVTGGNVTTGDSFFTDALGAILYGNVSAGLVNPQPPSEPYSVGLVSGTSISVGNVNATRSIALVSSGALTSGSLTTGGDVLGLADGAMSLGAITAGSRVRLADYSMYTAAGGTIPTTDGFNAETVFAAPLVATSGSIALGGAVSAAQFEAAAGTTLTGAAINSDGLLTAGSGGNMTLGNLVAGNDVRLTSGGNIATGSIDSGDDVALGAAGSISTLSIFAYDDVSATAGTTIATHDITGNSIDLFANGDITTGDLLTQDFFQGETQLVEGASITVQSGGDVDTDSIDSLDGVHVAADGTIATGTIDAEDFVELYAGGNITAAAINAGSYIDIRSDTGLLDLDDLHAGSQIDLESDGSLQFGDATADDFNFDIGGSVNGGDITAITHADGDAGGAIVLENITVTGPPNDGDFSIGFTSETSIAVQNVDGFDRVGFATLGDLTTGNIVAGSLVMTLAGDDIVTGSITTDGTGRVYIADASMFETGGGLGEDSDFDASIVLALAPVPTGGSVLIQGPVTTGQFDAAAEGDFTARAIGADSLNVYSEGTATVDGTWTVPDVTLVSRDINITANGRIDGGSTGAILLNSIHENGALIGDELTGSGYALSNAEFGRISGGDITIAVGGHGADADTLIGDLTITGPLAGSNIESNDGGVHFVTLSESGSEFDGTMRIVGDVVATGFGADNYLAFYTQNFELDAATGLISITGSGGALAGTLELYASRIHVAQGSLLDQLAANPQFAGYREALNQQASVQRPEGVIRAASFDIEFGGSGNSGPYSLLVQNMGTTAVPAGFLLDAVNIGDDGDGTLAAGSVDLAINGQIITPSGTLTGVAVRDLLVTEFGTAPFTAASTINGCALTGACGEPVPPKIVTPTSTDIPLSDNGGLGDGLFGNEGDIDDGETGDEGHRSSPIAPTNPLFDSRPLGASGDVDDPVSGAGNPSLYGSPEEVVGDGEDEDESKKKGDGK